MGKNKKCVESDTSSDSSEMISNSDSSTNGKSSEEFKIENPTNFFDQKELCHYKNIDKFFREYNDKHPENISKMIDIIEGKSDISLRILDWFVTKYSKKRINLNGTNKNVDAFDVKISYKAQLKAYKKRYFDPFRRRDKFYYPCTTDCFITYENESKYIYTTLGQLNFFKWAFTNNIISYVEENLHFVVAEMNIFNKDEKKKKIQLKDNVKKLTNNKKNQNVENKEEKVKEDKLNVNVVKSEEDGKMKIVLRFE